MVRPVSGTEGQIADAGISRRPTPASAARLVQGAPTQTTSTLPEAMASTMCGGGTTTRRTSRSGDRPAASSQWQS